MTWHAPRWAVTDLGWEIIQYIEKTMNRWSPWRLVKEISDLRTLLLRALTDGAKAREDLSEIRGYLRRDPAFARLSQSLAPISDFDLSVVTTERHELAAQQLTLTVLMNHVSLVSMEPRHLGAKGGAVRREMAAILTQAIGDKVAERLDILTEGNKS